jgi:hypothetical protein
MVAGVTATGLLLTFFAVSASARTESTALAAVTCSPPVGVNVVSGSNFEIDDNANLVTNGTGTCTDWNDVIPAGGAPIVKDDLPSGTGDDSLKNGADINDPQPSVDTGSIPNNKSDLSHFGVYVEHTGSKSFLNIFWSRVQNPSGTTDMDFEFNQKRCGPGPSFTDCADNTPSGGKIPIHVTPLRTQGDVMITYLLANGGTNPTINFRTWNGNATSGSWSAPTTIVAKASINTTAIASSDIGALSAFTFGEASIDTDQLFGTADCRSFGSVYLKSRASDTDNTAGKDLIAPEPVSVTNCGTVLVKKTDNAGPPANLLAGASFKIEKGKVVAGVENNEDTIPASSRAGFYCIGDIKLDSAASTHKVTETAAPTGYDPPNPAFQNITVSNTQLCADRLAATIPDANVQVDVTFMDTPQLGAIKIVKQAKDKNCANASSSSGSTLLKCTGTASVALLSEATFQICTNPGPYSTTPCTVAGTATTSSADSTFGTACVGGLPSGTGTTYYVHETGSGSTDFGADATDQSVTLTGNSTCPSPGAGNTKTFTDKPLSKIQVKFFSSAGTGITVATIACKKPDGTTISPDSAANGTDQSYSNLPYNGSISEHYTCEVNIDP